MRALTHIRTTYPSKTYTTAFAYLLHAFWTQHKVPNDIPTLTQVLSSIPADFHLDCLSPSSSSSSSSSPTKKEKQEKNEKLFTPEQITQILHAIGSGEVKAALRSRVDEAVARGAFGAPWIWATDARGRAEPFFGSDRWHAVYEFLGLPYQKMMLLPPPQQPQKQQEKAKI